ncbi:MAG: CDP-alcohol phosphatidyltransferase family protein, partial [Gemmatimonadaceae bacterium]
GLSAASFQARILGKTVTSLQLALLITVLVAPRFVQPLILIIAALSAVSVVDYTVALERARRRARNAPQS